MKLYPSSLLFLIKPSHSHRESLGSLLAKTKNSQNSKRNNTSTARAMVKIRENVDQVHRAELLARFEQEYQETFEHLFEIETVENNPESVCLWIPNPNSRSEFIFQECLELTESDILVDIGCGDGRVLLEGLKSSNARKAIGIEISRECIRRAEIESERLNVAERCEWRCESLFQTSYDQASLILLYLDKVSIVNVARQLRNFDVPDSCMIVAIGARLPVDLFPLLFADDDFAVYVYRFTRQ
jgi:hypothetical protein